MRLNWQFGYLDGIGIAVVIISVAACIWLFLSYLFDMSSALWGWRDSWKR